MKEIEEILVQATVQEKQEKVQTFLLAEKRGHGCDMNKPMVAVRVTKLGRECQHKKIKSAALNNLGSVVTTLNLQCTCRKVKWTVQILLSQQKDAC